MADFKFLHLNKMLIIAFVCTIQYNAEAQDSKVVVGYKSAKKAIKHNGSIPRLTYFIHHGDSLIQLFNVAITKKESNIELIGWVTPLEQINLDVYKKIENGDKVKECSEQEKLHSNQAHIFDNKVRSNNGRISFNLDQSDQYILYQNGSRKNTNLNWIMPAATGVGGAGIVALTIYGLSQIQWF